MKLWSEANTWLAKNAKARLENLQVEEVKQIVVIKHAAFGDLLLLRPFLITLRSHFPSARITLSVISHYTRGIPEDLVDHIHIVPSTKDHAGLKKTYQSYKKLGACDLLFDLTASTRSMSLSLLTRAKFKIGYQYRSLHKWIYDIAIPRSAYRFEAETFLEQLHPLGIPFELPLQFDMNVTAQKRDSAYLVYFPTASTPHKSWPAERFSKLIGKMAEKHPGFEHIVLSGIADWEKKVAKAIMAPLADRENVAALEAGPNDAELLKGASLLVSNDTGIRHLGIALEIPTVCIFSNTPPFRYWPRFGQHEVVYCLDKSMPEWSQVADSVERILN